MFLDIQINLILLKTFDQKFTLTTKKSLHIIFKEQQWINDGLTSSGSVVDLAVSSLSSH